MDLLDYCEPVQDDLKDKTQEVLLFNPRLEIVYTMTQVF